MARALSEPVPAAPLGNDSDSTPSQLFELKVLFFRSLQYEFSKADEALEALLKDRDDPSAVDTLYRFFHGLAGNAQPVGLQLVATVAGAAERIANHLKMDRYPDRREAIQLLADALKSVALVIEQHGRDEELNPAPRRTPRTAPSTFVQGRVPTENRENSKILVVDDDQFSAGLIDNCLRAAGFSCSHTCHPQQALRAIEAELPDLIILDVVMPGIDGFELCRRIRNHPALQFTPIIFVTQKGDVEQRVKGLEAGGNDYVAKPFEPEELIARVRSHLTRLAALREMAVRDSLTRCFNHKYFRTRLDQETLRAGRYDQRLTVAMVDIDNFKQINDNYGHPTGDIVLAHMANLVVASVRSSDVVARYGGEEFGILMVQAGIGEGEIVCNRLRERVEAYDFAVTSEVKKNESIQLSLTVSVGLAEFSHRTDSAAAILGRADAALYEAKRSGRNRVMLKKLQNA